MAQRTHVGRHTQVFIRLTSREDSAEYIVDLSNQFQSGKNAGAFESLTTNKDLGTFVGSWNLRLRNELVIASKNDLTKERANLGAFKAFLTGETRVSNWRDIARPQSLIEFFFDNELIMLGLVNDCFKEEAQSDREGSIVIDVNGSDMGKMLMHNLFFDAFPFTGSTTTPLVGQRNPIFKDVDKGLFDKAIGTTKELVIRALNILFFDVLDRVGFRFADNTKIGDYLEVGSGISEKLNAGYTMNFPLTSQTGSMYALMRLFSNFPLNEVFIDSGIREISLSDSDKGVTTFPTFKPRTLGAIDNVPAGTTPAVKTLNDFTKIKSDFQGRQAYVIIRPTPFDFDNVASFMKDEADDVLPVVNVLGFPSLPSDATKTNPTPSHKFSTLCKHALRIGNVISTAELISRKLGYDDKEVYSSFFISPVGASATYGDPAYRGIFKHIPRLLNTYKMNKMDIEFNYFTGATPEPTKTLTATKNNDFDTTIVEQLKRVANWFRFNDQYLKGTIKVYGKNFRIGDAVFLNVDDAFERRWYYIEGVKHEYVYPSHWTTTLRVTRGMPITGFRGEVSLPDPNVDAINNAIDRADFGVGGFPHA